MIQVITLLLSFKPMQQRQPQQPAGKDTYLIICCLMRQSRYWSMLITQIPCAKGMLQTADPGCRQYLTGVTGTLQSFNFANTNNPQLLAGKYSLLQSILTCNFI